jgi:FdhD protein
VSARGATIHPSPLQTGDGHSILATGSLNGEPVTWALPEEVPVAILINSVSHAVMMATPADLEDFAIGFALSEGLVTQARDIVGVLAFPSGEGMTTDIAIAPGKLVQERVAARTLEGRVGCGLCGVTEMKDAIRMPGGRLQHGRLSAAAVARAFADLPRFQPMNAVNRTVHAAAWCRRDGAIVLAREDVGRHNALDKLIGAMARADISPAHGFVLMSSRCSFELVQKCALAGIGALATVSAPTALAHRLARAAGVKLAALSKQGVMMFDGDDDGNA